MKFVLLGVLAFRALLLAIALLSCQLFPEQFSASLHERNFHGATTPGSLECMLSTWDAQWYLALAHTGYAETEEGGAAFYPLWPGLIRFASLLTGLDALLASLLLAHALFLGACALLYQKTAREHGPRVAATSVMLLAAYPGALFFGLPYSESLFLFLSVALFALVQQAPRRAQRAEGERSQSGGRAVGWAVLPALLLPLARPVGVLAAVPLALAVFLAWREQRLAPALVCTALAPLAGWGAYFAWMHASTGFALSGFEAQREFVSQASLAKLLRPDLFLLEFGNVTHVLAPRSGGLDRVLFLVYAALLIPLWRRDKSEFAWALVLGMIPAVTMSLMAFTRYLAVIFPVFVVAGGWLAEPEQRGRRIRALAFCAGLQAIFFYLHVNNHWVG
jgi:hypothetical protein